MYVLVIYIFVSVHVHACACVFLYFYAQKVLFCDRFIALGSDIINSDFRQAKYCFK